MERPRQTECSDPDHDERRRALLIGVGMAAIISAFPLTRFVFGYMGTLAHEFGHTVAAWLFGYPAIPAFNFQHGGGLTSIEERQWPLVLLCFATAPGTRHPYRKLQACQVGSFA